MLEAAYYGLFNVIKALESPQYTLAFQNGYNEGLLHYAAKGNQEKMVHYLLKRGCDPNVVNKFRESAIFKAAETGAIQILHTLYSDERTRVDVNDKFGNCILHIASREGQLEILDYILQKTKKLVTRTNQEGKSALRLATENGHITCAQLLRNFEAPLKSGNRMQLLKELAEKYVEDTPYYYKSAISAQHGERIEKPVHPMMDREDIEDAQLRLKQKAIK